MTTSSSPDSRTVDTDGVLIIGASQAGVQLAASLRERGWTAPITLVGAEPHLPYHRPPLSKKALHEGVDPADLALRSAQFFTDQQIQLVLGEHIAHVQTTPAGPGTATTATGQQFAFGRLALTVGARPRRLDLPGSQLTGIHYLRNSADALGLRQALVQAGRVVVIGGGFIGLEVAATARKLGCQVTVVLADDRLMARAVSPAVSEHFRAAHREWGVDIRCATLPAAYTGNASGAVTGVQLADGQTIAADTVIVGVGAAPCTELAEQLGLTVAGGIVVDDHALTSDGVTVAAGDCTVWTPRTDEQDPAVPPVGARFESVNAATEQAKVAAATLTGTSQPWLSAPWFWSDQFDLKLQAAGRVTPDCSTVHRADADGGLTLLHHRAGQLVAVECINRPADFMAARTGITKSKRIDPVAATDAGVPLKTLLTDLPTTHGSGAAA
jgi:3-phenylpropionate/trans-cinnamate dioxygenase ferredoxin reductase subunit